MSLSLSQISGILQMQPLPFISGQGAVVKNRVNMIKPVNQMMLILIARALIQKNGGVRMLLKKIAITAIFILCSCLTATSAGAQQQTDAHGRQWWQNPVFCELYRRRFGDSEHDGIGDLNGITSKLDYLHELGVDAIWITPCFPSPQ